MGQRKQLNPKKMSTPLNHRAEMPENTEDNSETIIRSESQPSSSSAQHPNPGSYSEVEVPAAVNAGIIINNNSLTPTNMQASGIETEQSPLDLSTISQTDIRQQSIISPPFSAARSAFTPYQSSANRTAGLDNLTVDNSSRPDESALHNADTHNVFTGHTQNQNDDDVAPSNPNPAINQEVVVKTEPQEPVADQSIQNGLVSQFSDLGRAFINQQNYNSHVNAISLAGSFNEYLSNISAAHTQRLSMITGTSLLNQYQMNSMNQAANRSESELLRTIMNNIANQAVNGSDPAMLRTLTNNNANQMLPQTSQTQTGQPASAPDPVNATTNDATTQNSKRIRPPKNATDRVDCPVCFKSICNKYFLKVHIKKAHPETDADAFVVIKSKKSQVTQQPKQPVHVRERPLNTSSTPPGCGEVMEIPPMNEEARMNIETNKLDPKAFCLFCNKAYCSKYFVKTHLLGTHRVNEAVADRYIGKKPKSKAGSSTAQSAESKPKRRQSLAQTKVICQYCDKTVCNKYFLRSHLSNVHKLLKDEALRLSEEAIPVLNSEENDQSGNQNSITPTTPSPTSLNTNHITESGINNEIAEETPLVESLQVYEQNQSRPMETTIETNNQITSAANVHASQLLVASQNDSQLPAEADPLQSTETSIIEETSPTEQLSMESEQNIVPGPLFSNNESTTRPVAQKRPASGDQDEPESKEPRLSKLDDNEFAP